MKKIISILTCLIVLFAMHTPALADNSSGDFTYYLLADGSAVITGYNGTAVDLVIPNTLDGYPVKRIGRSAFENKPLNVVVIQDGIEGIEYMAFSECKMLTRIFIPESVKGIDNGAFFHCEKLSGETSKTDYDTNLEEDIAKQQKRVEEAEAKLQRWIDAGTHEKDYDKQRKKIATDKEKLEQLLKKQEEMPYGSLFIPAGTELLPEGLEYIGAGAFQGCDSLRRVRLPESLTRVGSNPFVYCNNLTIIVSPQHPTLAMKDGALFSKPDKRLISAPTTTEVYYIPQGIKIIGDYAFLGSKANTIVIPDSVISIGIDALPKYGNVLLTTGGSEAETYCKQNYIPYSFIDSDMDWLTD